MLFFYLLSDILKTYPNFFSHTNTCPIYVYIKNRFKNKLVLLENANLYLCPIHDNVKLHCSDIRDICDTKIRFSSLVRRSINSTFVKLCNLFQRN